MPEVPATPTPAAQAVAPPSYLPLIALIVANLIPLAGVLWFGWDAAHLLILYWLENLVIGGYTVLRMLRASGWLSLGMILFFCIHFGGFCAVHGLFIYNFSHQGGLDLSPEGETSWFGPLVFVQLLVRVVEAMFAQAGAGLYLPLLALVVSHGVSFVMNYIVGEQDKGRRASQIMGDPYQRIVLLHVAVIAGGILSMKLGGSLATVVALVILKIVVDAVLHLRSHRPKRAPTHSPRVPRERGEIQADP